MFVGDENTKLLNHPHVDVVVALLMRKSCVVFREFKTLVAAPLIRAATNKSQSSSSSTHAGGAEYAARYINDWLGATIDKLL